MLHRLLSLLSILILSGFLVVQTLVHAAHAEEDWKITRFNSRINIQSDGLVAVSETIDADFGATEKHGIFRDIPYAYTTDSGRTYWTEISNIDVPNQEFEVEKDSSSIRIRIGDPDRLVSGRQVYKVTYTVSGVLVPFDTYDELYWNVTGNNWPVAIESSAAQIILPGGNIIQTSCYVGLAGETELCEQKKVDNQTMEFHASRRLAANEGLTVALGYTKGLVPILQPSPPPSRVDLFFSPQGFIPFLLVVVLGGIYLMRYSWVTGRDRWWGGKMYSESQKESIMPIGAHQTITPEFEPPETLRPAELGVLVDEKADTLDISATIVDLAVRGYLTIKEIPKKWALGSVDYSFTRIDKQESGLLEYEKLILKGLFETGKEAKMSELKYKFYDDLAKAKTALYKEATKKNLFAANPESVRTRYLIGAIVLAGAGVGLIVLDGIAVLVGIGVGAVICGLILLIASFFMPRRTAYGRETYRKALGYKLFVSGTEKYRQPFFEKENIFMEVLPYAIVFGVTDKLAKAFKEMGIQPPQPSWYSGTRPFNPITFSSSINSFSHSVAGVMAASPGGSGSGGGGSSGGGFGGGGGGSW